MTEQINEERQRIILHKEIDMIQDVIRRMANNSFLLKGWSVSIIIAVLALTSQSITASNANKLLIILLVTIVIFWYLDAFFLHKERCYRKLYSWVITNRLQSTEKQYDLNYTRFLGAVNNTLMIMLSKTLLPFYAIMGVFLFIILKLI